MYKDILIQLIQQDSIDEKIQNILFKMIDWIESIEKKQSLSNNNNNDNNTNNNQLINTQYERRTAIPMQLQQQTERNSQLYNEIQTETEMTIQLDIQSEIHADMKQSIHLHPIYYF